MDIKLPLKLFTLSIDDGSLEVDGTTYKGVPRLIEELLPVLYDPQSLDPTLLKKPLYYMFRDVARTTDRPLFESLGLRYDITVISSQPLGREFPKTLGHYHPEASNGLSYMEVYEVLHGKAHYLLQRRSREGKVDRVVLIEANPGDVVVIPPNYGHVTINPSAETLVMSNLVARGFKSIYDEYLEKRGALYYELVDGGLLFNERYESKVELERLSAPSGEFLLELKSDLYASFIEETSRFRFLVDPFLWKPE
ncbi:MAG TPA: glucose-6-phosphate isomerase [Candidatus Methanomethylia archaeon]|nr:glucose-6-phosphate isomerase [Candidatus Methanomethylicia archaeon]